VSVTLWWLCSRYPYHQQHTRCQVSYHGCYGRKLTDVVLAAAGYDASARLEDLTPAHIPHVHDFARDVNLTTEEHIRKSVTSWVEFSKSSRTETHIVGLRSLQVCIV
jgi:ribosomal protein S13